MPGVNIREIDTTGTGAVEYLDYTVLVPAPELKYNDDKQGDDNILEGVLTSLSDFDHKYVNKPEGVENDIGFLTAYQLVSKGLPVYYFPAYTYEQKSGESGDEPVVIRNFTEGHINNDGELKPYDEGNLFDAFLDKGKYDIRFITVGGFFDEANYIKVAKSALLCAAKRGDAVALLDVPAFGEAKDAGHIKALKNSTLIDQWVNENFGGTDAALAPIERKGISWTDKETAGRYGSMWAPITTVSLVKPTLNPKADEKATVTIDRDVPASLIYLTSFSRDVKAFPAWFAAAGTVRGISTYNNTIPTVDFGDTDINKLQARSKAVGAEYAQHIATNVICERRPYGNVL